MANHKLSHKYFLNYNTGYYPVSSYVNGGLNNQQPQPQQQQIGMNGIKIPQSQSADVSNSKQPSSGKTATVSYVFCFLYRTFYIIFFINRNVGLMIFQYHLVKF